MKFRIISVGKASRRSVSQLTEEYEKRLSRWITVEWQLVSTGRTVDEESTSIMRLIRPKDFVVLLDERGRQLTTSEMSHELDNWLVNGRPVVVVIGGAYGVNEQLRDRADYIWSFSKLVFPHQLMRILTVEQLYRLFSYRSGNKYHHE